MRLLLQLLSNGFVNGCSTALLALSFALIYNTTRTFHIAHGAVYTAAAYACYLFYVLCGWPLSLSVLLAVLLGAIIGVAMEITVYAPLVLRNSSPLVILISSLGVYIVIVNLIAIFFGNDTKLLHPGTEQIYHFGPVIFTQTQLITILAALILLPIFILFLNQTIWGKFVCALRDNAILANVIGINVQAVRLLVFGLGSSLAAVTAVLTVMDVGVDPQAGMPLLLSAVVALIIGGVGTFEGPVIGGFVLGLLQSIVVWFISAHWSIAITFAVLIIFLLIRPSGLIGWQQRLEESRQ